MLGDRPTPRSQIGSSARPRAVKIFIQASPATGSSSSSATNGRMTRHDQVLDVRVVIRVDQRQQVGTHLLAQGLAPPVQDGFDQGVLVGEVVRQRGRRHPGRARDRAQGHGVHGRAAEEPLGGVHQGGGHVDVAPGAGRRAGAVTSHDGMSARRCCWNPCPATTWTQFGQTRKLLLPNPRPMGFDVVAVTEGSASREEPQHACRDSSGTCRPGFPAGRRSRRVGAGRRRLLVGPVRRGPGGRRARRPRPTSPATPSATSSPPAARVTPPAPPSRA